MGEEIKILLVGLGSIGRRHLNHLKSIPGVESAAFRTRKGEITKESGIKEFFSFDEALAYQPDGVIISNPTSLHVETALPFLEKGIKVLIEKPIDTTLKNAQRLEPFKESLRIAYCMRFHPLSLFLKKLFKEERPFKVGFKRSFYLPKWHPYADYRKEYTALKSLGGGVIRTLSHEIDLSLDWFGMPTDVYGVTDKVSFLDLDTDDYAFFTTKSSNNTRINFELDFFSPTNVNEGQAFTSKGKYEWGGAGVDFTPYDGIEKEPVFSIEKEAPAEMYQKQMEDFCKFVRGDNSQNATYTDGINVLKVIDCVEER